MTNAARRATAKSQAIAAWLLACDSHELEEADLIAGLGRRLRAAGLQLDRLTLHLRTLHPEIIARTVAWAPDEPVEIYDREHGVERSVAFATSPVRRAMDRRQWLTARLDGAAPSEWTHLDVFRDRGLAELVVAPLVAGDGPASAVGFCTRRRAGFLASERRLLAEILPALRGACEILALRQAETTLLDTYVGAASGGRILAGHVRRGDVETLEAALLLCDLRGFTTLSDRLPTERVLALLNHYFDQVVPAIEAAGGEVLKFMGDAVLAYFAGGEAEQSCRAAFDAARAALARLAAAPAEIELHAGIALHYGEVGYGNIGSGDRLDFTVIGRDVNLTSRLQDLCSQSGWSLLMSERFARLLGDPGLLPLGAHLLPGFGAPVPVFGSEAIAYRNAIDSAGSAATMMSASSSAPR